MTSINQLVGKAIVHVRKDDETLLLDFGAFSFAVHNEWAFASPIGDLQREISGLEGRVVTSVQSTDDEILLYFKEDLLKVNLRPEGWRGPEAAVLYEGDRPLVVWS